MIAVEPFAPEHLDEIVVQPSQATALPPEGRRWFGERALALGPAWTMRDRKGRILVCGGLLIAHPGAATAWTVLTVDKGMAFLSVTRGVRAVLDAASMRRIEMLTDPAYPEAGEWARLLGFALEGVRQASAADGADQLCWVRIRRGQ